MLCGVTAPDSPQDFALVMDCVFERLAHTLDLETSCRGFPRQLFMVTQNLGDLLKGNADVSRFGSNDPRRSEMA